MKRSFRVRPFLVLALIFLSMTAFAMSDYFPRSWRFKMTVVVETPDGIVTGSAVREMSNSKPPVDLPDVGNPAKLRGEAVVVDLGERGVLFVLITDRLKSAFYTAFPIRDENGKKVGGTTPAGIRYYNALPVGTKAVYDPVQPPGYPNIVTFTDMGDPKSVTLVESWKLRTIDGRRDGLYELDVNRMEEIFGDGVRIKEIILEITDEPVTWGIVEPYLPWLDQYNNKLFDGNEIHTIHTDYPVANRFGAGHFRTRRE